MSGPQHPPERRSDRKARRAALKAEDAAQRRLLRAEAEQQAATERRSAWATDLPTGFAARGEQA